MDEPYVSIFDSTSAKAAQAAAKSVGQRRQKILAALAAAGAGGKTIWEIADELGVFDHQISGRFSELARDGLIVRGQPSQRRANPKTGCEADVWLLADTPRARTADRGDKLGYPPVMIMEDGSFERSPILNGDAPGIPYARTGAGAGAGAGMEIWRVELLECGGCGRALKLVEEAGLKKFRCGTPGCNRTWYLMMVREPGGPQVLAMVMKHL